MVYQLCIQGTVSKEKQRNGELAGMLEYYQGGYTQSDPESTLVTVFDPVTKKYDLKKITSEIWKGAPKKITAGKRCKEYWEQYHIQVEEIKGLTTTSEKEAFVRGRLFEYLQTYESDHQLNSLTKKDLTHVMENLYMIYNTDNREIHRVIQLIHLVSKNVIGKYIQIDGLERIFNEQYIDFEWEMHLGMDHKRQTMKFYRDHFIHQVRDAYMMDQMLENGGFYERTLRVLSQPSASKISRYFCKMVERQKEVPLANAKLVEHDPEFVPRNIIYMSAYMAALFHDIGYPNTYLQSLRRRISAFAPGMNPGTPAKDTLPGGIFSLLQNSLLFRVVPFEEIQTRVYQDSIDHGTLSAIAFLLHFYENGVIFMLPPYQAAAVELAGLAIYNHTYIYGIVGAGKKTANDYRPRFLTNPISYLLRLCDDLQEWDRVYFEISSNSNLITCNRCYTPVVGRSLKPDGQEEKRDEKKNHYYVCNCYSKSHILENGGAFSRTFDGELSFPYRRLYNIEVCDYVQVQSMDGKCFNETKDICFKLHYNPYKLLHIVYISPSYARYRIKELNQLKALLLNQYDLPNMWLEYFITANPILLKTYLMGEYFEKCFEAHIKERGTVSALQEKIEAFGKGKATGKEALDEAVGGLLNLLNPCLSKWNEKRTSPPAGKEYIEEEISRALRLYCLLYIYGQVFHCSEEWTKESPQWIVDEIREEYCGPEEEEFQCLLGDCLLQLSRLFTCRQLLKMNCVPDEYMRQFAPGNWKEKLTGRKGERCSKEFYDRALEWYVDQRTYEPICWNSKPIEERRAVDAYTDMGFFQMLYGAGHKVP